MKHLRWILRRMRTIVLLGIDQILETDRHLTILVHYQLVGAGVLLNDLLGRWRADLQRKVTRCGRPPGHPCTIIRGRFYCPSTPIKLFHGSVYRHNAVTPTSEVASLLLDIVSWPGA